MTELDKLQLRVDRAKRNLKRWIDFLESAEATAPNWGARQILKGIRRQLEKLFDDLEGDDR